MLQTVRNRRLVVVVLLGILNVQAAPSRLKYYVFPPYNDLARRAAIQGSVSVELTVSNGKVKRVDTIAHLLKSPSTAKIKNVPEFITKGIIDALSKWEFEQKDSMKFKLDIVFRLVKHEDMPDGLRYRFSLRESDGWPTQILIEAEYPSLMLTVPAK